MLCDKIFSNIECIDDCWEWQSRKSNGYGMICVNGQDDRVHRVMYQLCRGTIPKGMFVLHKCDNRCCVNPAHLFIGTQQDNIDDMFSKNRQPNFKGENNNAAKLVEDDVKQIRRLHSENRYTQSEIGELFDVSRRAISLIVNKQRWAHVE